MPVFKRFDRESITNLFCCRNVRNRTQYVRLSFFPLTFRDRLNSTFAMPDNHYDAIVVGSGISGGWAAKELTEKGLRVLMLERGRPHDHITGSKTATVN